MDTVEVDENGFVWIGGLKVCRIVVGGLIEFFDRDRRRSERRGSQFVYTTLDNFSLVLSGKKRKVKETNAA